MARVIAAERISATNLGTDERQLGRCDGRVRAEIWGQEGRAMAGGAGAGGGLAQRGVTRTAEEVVRRW